MSNNEQEPLQRVAILGLGLMGASLGMALRASGCAQTIAGYDATPEVAVRAKERGAIDHVCSSVAEAVATADLVVLAVPVLAMHELLVASAPLLAPSALVTDLGSTKATVVSWGEALVQPPAAFVGSHPMMGSEQSGPNSAFATLYQGCHWCLTPSEQTPPAALQRLRWLVEQLGAQPIILSPEQHDKAVALVSHLPRLTATALMLTAAHASHPEQMLLAAGGFRDTTRIASGDPRMARDICLTNTVPLAEALDQYIASLHELRQRLLTQDTAIEDLFSEAKTARDSWLKMSADAKRQKNV